MKTGALLLSLVLILVGSPTWAGDELVSGPDRRHEIDLRIERLDAERAAISTRGAKTTLFVGLGTMVLGAVPLAVGLTAAYPEGNEYARSAGGIVSGSTLIGIGMVTSIVAGIVWGERINQRNEIDAERGVLIERRDGLAAGLSHLEIHSAFRDDAHFVTLGFRF
jgi:hypothetical protein